MAVQVALCRQSEAQAGVAWQGGAREQQLLELDGGRFIRNAVLARAHQLDRVAERSEPACERLHGQGDPVDLRRPGLGDDRYAHAQVRIRGMRRLAHALESRIASWWQIRDSARRL